MHKLRKIYFSLYSPAHGLKLKRIYLYKYLYIHQHFLEEWNLFYYLQYKNDGLFFWSGGGGVYTHQMRFYRQY